MFGVLVVEDQTGSLGWLAAYSGKLSEEPRGYFVPPVADIHAAQSFYKKGEAELNAHERCDCNFRTRSAKRNSAKKEHYKIAWMKLTSTYARAVQHSKKLKKPARSIEKLYDRP